MMPSNFRHLLFILVLALSGPLAHAMGKNRSTQTTLASEVCNRHVAPTLLPPSPTPIQTVPQATTQAASIPGKPTGPLDPLLFLFPALTRYQLEEKLRNSVSDELTFFRGTAPLFYYLLSQSENELVAFEELMSFAGVIMGDPHPENFGAIVINDTSAVYTANDVDDSITAPYVLDLIRYFSSIRLLRPDANLEPVLAAYIAGVQGTLHSRTLRDSLIFDSLKQGKGTKLEKGDVDLAQMRFFRNPNDVFDSATEDARIYCGLAMHHYQGTKCLDVVRLERRTGGSAFIPRAWVLIETPSGIRHVEFKTQYRSSVEAWFANSPGSSNAVRIEEGLNVTLTGVRTRETQAILSDQTTILMRPRYSGSSSLKFSKLPADQQLALFTEQAHTLGQIHAKTAGKKSKKYIQALQRISMKKWEDLSFKLIKELRQWHQYTKSLP